MSGTELTRKKLPVLFSSYWESLPAKTRKCYARDVAVFDECVGKPAHECDINDVRRFLTDQRARVKSGEIAPGTFNHRLYGVRAVFNAMVRDPEIPVRSNPVAELEAALGKSLRLPIDPGKNAGAAQRLLPVIRDVIRGASNPMARTAIEITYQTGARVSEMTDAKKSSVHPHDGEHYRWTIFGKGSKERDVFLTVDLFGRLPAGEYLLGRHYDRSTVFRWVRAAFREFGFDGVHPHEIRHLHALTLRLRSADPFMISRHLGHSRLTFTLEVYGQPPQVPGKVAIAV